MKTVTIELKLTDILSQICPGCYAEYVRFLGKKLEEAIGTKATIASYTVDDPIVVHLSVSESEMP